MVPSREGELMDPEKIGRYQILRPLAQGGMGTTWLARDPELDRVVVTKGLRAEATSSTKERERLVREARLLAGLGHPNIVHVYDLVEQAGQWFICMQQARGRTLRDLLRDGPLPLAGAHASSLRATGFTSLEVCLAALAFALAALREPQGRTSVADPSAAA
jgi:serine/threonine protein kinase